LNVLGEVEFLLLFLIRKIGAPWRATGLKLAARRQKNFGAPGGAPPPILNHTFAAVISAWRGFGDYFIPNSII
jgi:hypothetical protein